MAIALLPHLLALLTGCIGALLFGGTARLACAAGAAMAGLALARCLLVTRATPGRAVASVPTALLQTLPAALLLGAIIALTRSGLLPPADDAMAASADPRPDRLIVDDSDVAQACLADARVEAYVDALYRRLQRKWDEGGDSRLRPGSVVLAFILDAEGAVRLSRVIESSSDAYRDLGTRTLATAAPFGPLQGQLQCLTRLELRATLERDPRP